MPTMWVTMAYITRNTAWWDVEFYVDKTPRTSQQLYQYLLELKQQAARDKVRLLEFTVFDGKREVWRGLV